MSVTRIIKQTHAALVLIAVAASVYAWDHLTNLIDKAAQGVALPLFPLVHVVFIDNIAIFIHQKVKEAPFVDVRPVMRIHFSDQRFVDFCILLIFVDIKVK